MLDDNEKRFIYFMCKYLHPLSYRFDEVHYEEGDWNGESWDLPPSLQFRDSETMFIAEFPLTGQGRFYALGSDWHKLTDIL